jgi:hypothetical protein
VELKEEPLNPFDSIPVKSRSVSNEIEESGWQFQNNLNKGFGQNEEL